MISTNSSQSTLQRYREARRLGDHSQADALSCRLGLHTWRRGEESCACESRGKKHPHARLWVALLEKWEPAAEEEDEAQERIGEVLERIAHSPQAARKLDWEPLLGLVPNFEDWGTYAKGYAEPGYSEPEGRVLIHNWNETPQPVQDLLEALGCSLEWSDEWLVCDCGKAFRAQPDSFSWSMHGFIGDGDYCCGDCVSEDPEGSGYLDSLRAGYRPPVDTLRIDLSEHGFGSEALCEVYASDADKVRAHCEERDWEVIFQAGTYGSRYAVWARSKSDGREPEEIDGPALSLRCARSFPCVRFDVGGGVYSIQD